MRGPHLACWLAGFGSEQDGERIGAHRLKEDVPIRYLIELRRVHESQAATKPPTLATKRRREGGHPWRLFVASAPPSEFVPKSEKPPAAVAGGGLNAVFLNLFVRLRFPRAHCGR